ncbi:MAG: hypothetical protein HY755_09040 [Nitrospirae bacterium]|nr:hypothetical protein [Nitrospirota bacterium]
MRVKLLFLAKVLGYSLALFALWHPISNVYGFFLNLVLSRFYPLYYMLKPNEKFPYIASLTLIPFISLIIATPKMKLLKKAVIITTGTFVFLLIDFVAVQLEIDEISGNPTAFITYRSIKLFIPFLMWILTSYPYLGEVFKTKTEETSVTCYSCPICRTEHSNIMDHIREVHGEKSLKSKKVRKFISKNQL